MAAFAQPDNGLRVQTLVMEKLAVRRHYLRTWFALDLAAAFPLDLLFAGKRLDIWRLPRLLKIIRVLKYKSLHHAGEPLCLSRDGSQSHQQVNRKQGD